MTQSILYPFVIAEDPTLRGRCIIEGLSLLCFKLEVSAFHVDIWTKRPLCKIKIASNWLNRRTRVLYGLKTLRNLHQRRAMTEEARSFTRMGLLALLPRFIKSNFLPLSPNGVQ